MDNCKIEVTPDRQLIIRVDLTKECGPTKGGRSVRIGSTAGNLQLWANGEPLGIRCNVNVFRSMTEQEKEAYYKKGYRY